MNHEAGPLDDIETIQGNGQNEVMLTPSCTDFLANVSGGSRGTTFHGSQETCPSNVYCCRECLYHSSLNDVLGRETADMCGHISVRGTLRSVGGRWINQFEITLSR